jgi:hypothetical protein
VRFSSTSSHRGWLAAAAQHRAEKKNKNILSPSNSSHSNRNVWNSKSQRRNVFLFIFFDAGIVSLSLQKEEEEKYISFFLFFWHSISASSSSSDPPFYYIPFLHRISLLLLLLLLLSSFFSPFDIKLSFP